MAEQLKSAFEKEGLSCPAGLIHLLFHHEKGRKASYKSLYGVLVFGEKLAPPGATLVYPSELREAVRQHFQDNPEAGRFDKQYESSGRPVTMTELAAAKFRTPAPGKCCQCGPDTPGPVRTKRAKKSNKPY